jgi:O-antigen/teichoic acid export membrane protein
MLRIGAQHADKVFLFHFLGAPQVAIYVLATAIPNELSSVFSHVNNLAFPKLVGRDAGELKASLPRKLLVFTLALIAIVALYVLVSPHLFRFFFPEYLSSVPYSQLFALTLLFLPVGVLLQRFYAARDLRVIGILNVAEPLVLLSLYVLLIPIFGIWGAVYAVLGKHVVSALILVYCFALR